MEPTQDSGKEQFFDTVSVEQTTSTSLELSWQVIGKTSQNIVGFQVHFQKIASNYVQYSPELSASSNKYNIDNLITDTYYKVCLVMYRNDTSEVRECVDASTTNWHIPVSIGSSIGAVLALSIIVLLVLISRCPSVTRKKKKSQTTDSAKYDSMSSHFHGDDFELSDTTHAQDDDVFSEHDSTSVEVASSQNVHELLHAQNSCPTHLQTRTGPPNGNRNYIKSLPRQTSVSEYSTGTGNPGMPMPQFGNSLHVQASRTYSHPIMRSSSGGSSSPGIITGGSADGTTSTLLGAVGGGSEQEPETNHVTLALNPKHTVVKVDDDPGETQFTL